jgi:hypothetical protein
MCYCAQPIFKSGVFEIAEDVVGPEFGVSKRVVV